MIRNNHKGFTLLEVMIALTIVAIGLTAVLTLGIRSIETSERVERTSQAVLLAQQKMAEIESGVIPKPDDGEEQPFEPPQQQFSWTASYTPTPITGLRQMTLEVLWQDGSSKGSVTLDSYVKD